MGATDILHVATFSPHSIYQNQRLTFLNDVFVIEGSGEVDARHIVEFDSKGELVWQSAELRGWVYEYASSLDVAPVQGGTDEQVQSIIPDATLEFGLQGLLGKRHTLILTDRRVIFARKTKAGMKQRVADARESANSGSEFLDQLGAHLDAFLGWDEERYLTMSPEHALAEATGNFAVERSEITKTSFKTRRLRAEGNVVFDTDDLLVIKTHGKKYKIRLGSGKHQAKRALKVAGLR